MSQSSSSGDGEGECSICRSTYFDIHRTCTWKADIDCGALQKICQGCGNIREEVKCYCRNLSSPAPAASS
jgi:hypothetical protein